MNETRCLQAGPLDPQRRFCCTVIGLLIRLSFGGHVKKVLPPGWEDMFPAHDSAVSPPAIEDSSPAALEQPYEDIMLWIREKLPAAEMLTRLRALIEADDDNSAAVILERFTHCLLFAAQKTPFHTITLIARYKPLFQELCLQVRTSCTCSSRNSASVSVQLSSTANVNHEQGPIPANSFHN